MVRKIKTDRKSQLKMTENIAVLFVFFLILAFGMIFYMNVMKSTAQKEEEENFALKAIRITQLVNYLPELQCSMENIVIDACFDIMKVEAFAEIVDENQFYYYDFFEYSNISVTEVYPDQRTWTIYENLPDDHIQKSSLVTHVPISLFNATAKGNKVYRFGVLNVVVYAK